MLIGDGGGFEIRKSGHPKNLKNNLNRRRVGDRWKWSLYKNISANKQSITLIISASSVFGIGLACFLWLFV
jgi:hypothetical protein